MSAPAGLCLDLPGGKTFPARAALSGFVILLLTAAHPFQGAIQQGREAGTHGSGLATPGKSGFFLAGSGLASLMDERHLDALLLADSGDLGDLVMGIAIQDQL